MVAGSRVETVLLGATGAALVASVAVAGLVGVDGTNAFLVYGSQGLVYLLAALFLATRARADNVNWAYIAGAFLIMTFSSICYQFDATVQIAGHGMDLGDAVWLIAYPLNIIGVARLARQGQRATRLEWLDVLVVSAAGFGVAALGMDRAIVGSAVNQNTPDITVNVVSVLFDMALLSVVLGAVQRAKWRPDPAVRLLAVAAVLYAVFDSQYAVQIITNTYSSGGWFDVAWPLSGFLFVIAARIGRADSVARAETAAANSHVYVPALFTLIAGAVLVAPYGGALGLVGKVFAFMALLPAVIRMYLTIAEVTRLAAQLRAAHADGDTGLPNRRWLLDSAVPRADGAVVIEFELNGLAEVHTDFGTRVGSAVTAEAASRIRGCIRSDDILLRSGEERFAVLLRESSIEVARALAASAISAIEQPMSLDGFEISVSANVGISSQGGETSLPGELLAEASAALLEGRRIGGAGIQSFSGHFGERSQERLRMRAEIREILRGSTDALVPHFQPIVHVETRAVLAVELQMRWHRDGKVLLPAAFMSELDDTVSLEAWTKHAVRSGFEFLRANGLDLRMAVNVRHDLLDAEFVADLRETLAQTGARADQLVVEVTQDGDNRAALTTVAAIIAQLRGEGVLCIVADSERSGSSLLHLRDYVVDGIKFGRGLTEDTATDDVGAAILRGATGIAAELGMFVVYDGIETPDALSAVSSFGSAYAQGSSVARAMSARDLALWLESRSTSQV